MTKYPLLVAFRDKVEGHGFLADVAAHGRALAIHEQNGQEGWQIHGVQPGRLVGAGTTFLEAYVDFRKAFTGVLFDIADEAETFRIFTDRVRRFFDELDEVEEWQEAVRAVREGRVRSEGIPLPGDGIRKDKAESPRFVEVIRKHEFKPNDNELDPQPAIAA